MTASRPPGGTGTVPTRTMVNGCLKKLASRTVTGRHGPSAFP